MIHRGGVQDVTHKKGFTNLYAKENYTKDGFSHANGVTSNVGSEHLQTYPANARNQQERMTDGRHRQEDPLDSLYQMLQQNTTSPMEQVHYQTLFDLFRLLARRPFVTKTDSPSFGLPTDLGPTPATPAQIVTPDGQNLQRVVQSKAHLVRGVSEMLANAQNVFTGHETFEMINSFDAQMLSQQETQQNVGMVAALKTRIEGMEEKIRMVSGALSVFEAEEERYQADVEKFKRHVSDIVQLSEKRSQELSARLTEEANIKRAEVERILVNAEAASARVEVLKTSLLSTLQERDKIYEQANKHWEDWKKSATQAHAAQCAKYKRAKWHEKCVQKLLTPGPLVQSLRDRLQALVDDWNRERQRHDDYWMATRKAVQTSLKMLGDELQNLVALQNLERQRHEDVTKKLKLGGPFHEMLKKLEQEMERNDRWVQAMQEQYRVYKDALNRLDTKLAPAGKGVEDGNRTESIYELENESVNGSRPFTVGASEAGSDL